MHPGDRRPHLALLGLALALALAYAVPASRAWLLDDIVMPLVAQGDPSAVGRGYSATSLAFWAGIGGVLAWVAYDLLFTRARFVADAAFFTALAPFLLFGPLFHALLIDGVFPPRGVLAVLAAEPLVYLTTAVLAAAGLALGRIARREVVAPLALGVIALVPLVAFAGARADAAALGRGLLLAAIAFGAAGALAWGYHKWRPADGFAAAFALIWAHALDGATTWMVLRDPIGIGFEGFGERNPVSETLVNLSNGWPYFAVKLALPIVLLSLIRTETEEDERVRAFLLLAVFVLGYGPGMSNLLQVLLG